MSNSWFALAVFLVAGSADAMAVTSTELAGKPIVIEAEPALPKTACSFRRAICVHGGDGPRAVSAIGALERAWDAGLVLGVPLPRSFDAYIASEKSRSAISDRDLLSHFDRARAFSILDSRATGCALDFEAARELFAASALASAPAIDDVTLRAESTALAELAAPCASVDASRFQSQPERALADPDQDEGASAFYSWVDATFGKQPGRMIAATWALSPTRTTRDDHWTAEPDVFDVLRESFDHEPGQESKGLDDALVAFAQQRLSLDSPVRFDWDVPWPKAARAFASVSPVAPTGSSYVRVGLAGHAAGARFRIDATWEEHARMRFVVVKIDASGHAMAQWPATAQPKATEAHLQVVDLDGGDALVVIATNVGDWTSAFDPDDGPWEPHGWLLTIAPE